MQYVRSDWYWIVDDSEVYSSAQNDFVPPNDKTYAAWQTGGGEPTRIDHDGITRLRIDALEESITPRRIREAVLGTDKGWLKSVESKIAALRESL